MMQSPDEPGGGERTAPAAGFVGVSGSDAAGVSDPGAAPAEVGTAPTHFALAPADVSPEPADFSLEPADVSLVPADVSLVPADLSLVPADLSLVPADLSLVPADLSLVPAEFALALTDSAVALVDSPVAPGGAEVAADSAVPAADHAVAPAGAVASSGDVAAAQGAIGSVPAGAGVEPPAAALADAVGGADPSTLRLRLDVSYDGTDFSGWAVQPGRRTVAGELSAALAVLFRRPVPLVVAGRTDTGVHAVGQVAHVDVDPGALVALARRSPGGVEEGAEPFERGAFGLLRRLAGLLDDDVRVRRITIAPDGFDARFAALRRHYRYRIAATEFGVDPLRRRDTLAWSRPLDVGRMAAAGHELVGLHDFAAYCKPAHDGASTIRELQSLTVSPLPDEPDVIAVEVSADAFCHSMVRSLVGALLAVGDGRTPVERPRNLLAAQVRSNAIHSAPARGLTLVRVDYPDVEALHARAALTRAVRRASDVSGPRSAGSESTGPQRHP